MSAVAQIMSKALADAPSTTVTIVIPNTQRFIVTVPVDRFDQPVYVVPVPPHLLPCYDVLQDLTPDLPMTFDYCRAYTTPKNWEEIFKLQRVPLIDYALDHHDEPTTVFLIAMTLHRLAQGNYTSADVFVRNLCASRLAIIEASYLAQHVERTRKRKSLDARQLAAFDYMTLYWSLVAVGHLQLSGTEYNSSMIEDFLSAQRSVAHATMLLNTL